MLPKNRLQNHPWLPSANFLVRITSQLVNPRHPTLARTSCTPSQMAMGSAPDSVTHFRFTSWHNPCGPGPLSTMKPILVSVVLLLLRSNLNVPPSKGSVKRTYDPILLIFCSLTSSPQSLEGTPQRRRSVWVKAEGLLAPTQSVHAGANGQLFASLLLRLDGRESSDRSNP